MAPGPDYMTPEMYMGFYRNMTVTLANGSVVQVDIRKYLNHGKVVPFPPAGSHEKRQQPSGTMATRATAADAEYWRVISRVAVDPFRDSPEGKAKKIGLFQVPLTFTIQGKTYDRRDVHRAYMGKGSSIEIARALMLASRYSQVISTVDYCDKFLGLDCNGFVSNYWGKEKPENVDVNYFDDKRRKDLAKLTVGDALVYYKGTQNRKPRSERAAHIAVVNEVSSVTNSGTDTAIEMNIVQSAGEDEGVRKSETRTFLFKQNADKEYYYYTSDASRIGYPCEGPTKARPRGF